MQERIQECVFVKAGEPRERLTKRIRCKEDASQFLGRKSESKVATPPKDVKRCEANMPIKPVEEKPSFSLLGAYHGVGGFASHQDKKPSHSQPKLEATPPPQEPLLKSNCLKNISSAETSQRCSPLHRVLRVLRFIYLLMPVMMCVFWLAPHVMQCLPVQTQSVALLLFPNLRPWVVPSVAVSPSSESLSFKVADVDSASTTPASGVWVWVKSLFQSATSAAWSAPSRPRPSLAVPASPGGGSYAAGGGQGPPSPSLPTLSELQSEFAHLRPGFIDAPEALKAHSQTFKKEVLEVVEGVFVALGYGLANCVILEGPLGLVVVDTMESPEAMTEVWADFSKVWRAKQRRRREGAQPESEQQQQQLETAPLPPVLGIIYTHFHSDHTFGASVVYVEGQTEVHAYWLTRRELEKVVAVTSGSTYRRGMRQFGVYVHEKDMINAGIGPKLRYRMGVAMGTVPPTHVMWGERKKVFLAGLALELLHAPGESKDQTIVWLEESRVLLAADNVYKALPNIYAIRGTETRNCLEWIQSLDTMRELKPEVMVLGHTRPVVGEREIADLLRNYRDAIKFIHDQTVRLMNKGLSVEAIAETVVLPEPLRKHPYLQPLYGSLPWAVRAVFNHYMGWFGGRAEDLNPLTQAQKARMLERLAGDSTALLRHALQFLREGKFQWALEAASAAQELRPEDATARWLTAASLRALASTQTAASGAAAMRHRHRGRQAESAASHETASRQRRGLWTWWVCAQAETGT